MVKGCVQAIWRRRTWLWFIGWCRTPSASETRKALHIHPCCQGFYLKKAFLTFWGFVYYRFGLICILHFQHYQRDIVCGVEGYIVTGSKQVEIGDLLTLESECWFMESYFICYRLKFGHMPAFHCVLIVPQGRSSLRIAGSMVQRTHVQMVTY